MHVSRVRRWRRGAVVAALMAMCWSLVCPVQAVHAATDVEQGDLALSDARKKALMLDVIETFVPHAESFWRDDTDPTTPWTGSFDAAGPGVTQPRGGGNMALAYATVLAANPDQATFGGVPRATLHDHVVQTIRHEAYTNALVRDDGWGGGTWQAALETYGWAYAAHLLWDSLDADTRGVVERVVVGEADLLLTKPPATGSDGNTGAEDNGWNAPLTALAVVMFPDHPHRARWNERTQLLAMNTMSRAADEDSDEVVDGKPVSQWVETVNLFDDFTLENHGFFNPIYLQVSHLTLNDAAVFYGQAGEPLPEALSFRFPEVWKGVLGALAADDGDLIMPAGQDWTSKDYQHLEYLGALATRFKRADASVAESVALQTIARRQAGHTDGSIIGQPELGYESMLIKRMAMAWWTHETFGPSPTPTRAEYDRARRETGGVQQFPDARVISARQRDATVTMSWDDNHPMGLIVPSARGHRDDPAFTAYLPGSAVGEVAGLAGEYRCDCRENYFSTAGSIGQRQFSMTSFADGMTMLLDRGRGRTFSFGFEADPAVTGPRPVYSEGGAGLGTLDGTWANVADRFGLAVAGGAGLEATNVAGANTLQVDGSRAPTNVATGRPILASSSQDRYPAGNANDGDTASFWVSNEPATPDSPQWLEVDLGEERQVSDLTMTPRTNYGPREVTWQIPDGNGGWRAVATTEAAASGTTTATIDPVTTDTVRLVATAGHNPRNVQVAELGLSDGEVSGTDNRGAAVYPLQEAPETERLSREIQQPAVPDGWSALIARAPDGTDRLAIGHWTGTERIEIPLSTSRGAPLTDRPATVNGAVGHTSFDLPGDAPASRGEVVAFSVRSQREVTARTTSDTSATIVNAGSAETRVVVTYASDGQMLEVSRTIADRHRAEVRYVDGQLSFVQRPMRSPSGPIESTFEPRRNGGQ